MSFHIGDRVRIKEPIDIGIPIYKTLTTEMIGTIWKIETDRIVDCPYYVKFDNLHIENMFGELVFKPSEIVLADDGFEDVPLTALP